MLRKNTKKKVKIELKSRREHTKVIITQSLRENVQFMFQMLIEYNDRTCFASFPGKCIILDANIFSLIPSGRAQIIVLSTHETIQSEI